MAGLRRHSRNDSFYVAPKAFKFEPTKEQVDRWMRYLRTVAVCDTRLSERACPETEKRGG